MASPNVPSTLSAGDSSHDAESKPVAPRSTLGRQSAIGLNMSEYNNVVPTLSEIRAALMSTDMSALDVSRFSEAPNATSDAQQSTSTENAMDVE